MLPLPPFSLEAPDRLHDLLDLAAAPGARILAGGTDLLPSMKHRLFQPATLVSLGRLPGLRQIQDTGGGLQIGAAVTLTELRQHPLVRARYPALAEAAATVATPTLQGMGTLGGNVMLDTRCLYYNQPDGWRAGIGGCLKAEGTVCHVARTGTGCYAAHSADTVPALWLYGATLELASTAGTRRVALSELYGEDGRTWLKIQPGEVLLSIHLPPPSAPVVHRKVRRRAAIDYGLLLVAVQAEGEGGRAVLSALGPRPVEVVAERIHELPELAWAAARPLSTHATPSTWRKHMVRVEVCRAVAALQRISRSI